MDVIDWTRQFLIHDRKSGPILINWDYRRDLPQNVPAGEFERRSLELVDESQLLIGILGPSVPALTRKEILRGYARQAGGEQMRAYVLADPALTSAAHTSLLRKIRRDYSRDVTYGHYHTSRDFLHQMHLTLFRFLLDYWQSTPAPAQTGVIQ